MIKTTIKKLEKSEIEIEGLLEVSEFEKYEEKALTKIGERLELPGFRKGKAPPNMIKGGVSEMELLEEMAERAISEAYPKILEDNKIDAIGRPQITITKIGKGSNLEFKILTAVLPEIKLPDYKKIASEKGKKEEFNKEIVIEETEVEKVILDLRKMRAEQTVNKDAHAGHENMTEEPARPHDHSASLPSGSRQGAGGEHAKAHQESTSSADKIPESEYPEWNDEFAKSFGNFKTADELKEKIKTNLKIEKETQVKDKLRLEIIEEIMKHSEGEIPEILIESETDKILYRLQADITNMGFKYEDYLIQIKKTEENLRKEWRVDAEKRGKLQVIIHTISEKENLKPTEEEIIKEVGSITTMYKDADPVRARAYVEQMLENEKVFTFLETQ